MMIMKIARTRKAMMPYMMSLFCMMRLVIWERMARDLPMLLSAA
jgi:Na+/alanine symporter